jgi:hypothetical protein
LEIENVSTILLEPARMSNHTVRELQQHLPAK